MKTLVSICHLHTDLSILDGEEGRAADVLELSVEAGEAEPVGGGCVDQPPRGSEDPWG